MTPNQATLIVAFIALCAAAGAGYLKGYENGHNQYLAFKAQVGAQQQALKAEADQARVASERVTKATADGWAAAVDWHRAHPRVVRVQPADRNPREVPGLSAAAGKPDGAAAPDALCTRRTQAPADAPDLNDAIEDAARVLWLQDWIRKQHEASK